MWLWLLVILSPFIILAIIEELIEFFVNRYVLGPADWEGKLKFFVRKTISWIQKKLKKETSTS